MQGLSSLLTGGPADPDVLAFATELGLLERPERWRTGRHWRVMTPLRGRIEQLIADVDSGRTLTDAALAEVATRCEPYLDADPVAALMAAQILCLWALRGGARVRPPVAGRVAAALARGVELQRELGR